MGASSIKPQAHNLHYAEVLCQKAGIVDRKILDALGEMVVQQIQSKITYTWIVRLRKLTQQTIVKLLFRNAPGDAARTFRIDSAYLKKFAQSLRCFGGFSHCRPPLIPNIINQYDDDKCSCPYIVLIRIRQPIHISSAACDLKIKPKRTVGVTRSTNRSN